MSAPLLVTVAVIYDKNKILLIKRARDPFKGFWSFVGGCGAFEYHSDPRNRFANTPIVVPNDIEEILKAMNVRA